MRTNEWVGKRKAARQSVNMRGEIRFLDGRDPLECRITDISSTGCGLELKEPFPEIEDFDLFIEARSETKFCKVRRGLGGTTLGVAFLRSRNDDPLVMQALMERVARLERGFAELKGEPAPEGRPSGSVERRVATEGRRADDRELDFAWPSIDQRLTALAAGQEEARLAMEGLAHGARVSEAMTREIADVRADVAALRVALDDAAAGSAPDHSRELDDIRAEMSFLRAALATATGGTRGAPDAAVQRELKELRDSLKVVIALLAKTLNATARAA